jgi:hypothetical protein
MLVNPKIRVFNEANAIVVEVEDEGTLIKVDITDKALSILEEIENEEKRLEELINNPKLLDDQYAFPNVKAKLKFKKILIAKLVKIKIKLKRY